jgi:hypothetical protein
MLCSVLCSLWLGRHEVAADYDSQLPGGELMCNLCSLRKMIVLVGDNGDKFAFVDVQVILMAFECPHCNER